MPSDAIGHSDAALLRRCATADGTLLHPGAPAVLIDAAVLALAQAAQPAAPTPQLSRQRNAARLLSRYSTALRHTCRLCTVREVPSLRIRGCDPMCPPHVSRASPWARSGSRAK